MHPFFINKIIIMVKGLKADIVVTIYILTTLLFRFILESTLHKHPIISVSLGIVLLVFLWALIKIKVLVPDYYGLLKSKSKQ